MLDQELTRVGIVDDHEVVRLGLATAIAKRKDLRLIGEGTTADDALRIAKTTGLDVLILDLSIPGGGMHALKEISRTCPKVRSIIFTASDDATVAMAAIHYGARGFVLKGAGIDNLFSAVRIVMANQSYVSPEFATRLVAAAVQAKDQSEAKHGLNIRESQVMQEARRGLTNRQIGERLMLSERTVKHYMSSAMQKFGVSNRVAAVNAHREKSGNS